MATETHVDDIFPSGKFPELNEETRIMLVSSMGSVFLMIGAAGSKQEDMAVINLGIEGAKNMREQLKWALGNVGGMDLSEFR